METLHYLYSRIISPPVDDWSALQEGIAHLVGDAVKQVTEAILSTFKDPPAIFSEGEVSLSLFNMVTLHVDSVILHILHPCLSEP